MTDRERIIQFIEDTEYDRNYLPHFGLIPDWFVRYKELRDLIISYLDRLEESQILTRGHLKMPMKLSLTPRASSIVSSSSTYSPPKGRIQAG